MLRIGNSTLYHGDAIELLPSIKADMICTDPPYKLTSGGGTPNDGRRMSGKFNPTEYNNNGNIVDCDIDWTDFMPLLYQSLNDNSHAYVMANNRHVQNMLNSAEQAGFNFHNLLVWDKSTATPNRWYMKNCEFTGFFYKGKAKYINDCGAKQLLYVPQELYGDHPTTKPIMLMRHYIEMSSKKDDTVLDPFMGSCSTGIAALQSGRKFIGIEKSEKYFNLSVKRVNEFYDNYHQKSMI